MGAVVSVRCPWCATVHDEHGSRDLVSVPIPGDISICGVCIGIGVFIAAQNGLALRRANRAELSMVMRNDDVRSGLEALWSHLGKPAGEAIDAWREL